MHHRLNLKSLITCYTLTLLFGLAFCAQKGWCQVEAPRTEFEDLKVLDGPMPELGKGRDLTTKFRFIEQYAESDSSGGFLSQYDVAFRESIRITNNNPGPAPTTEKIIRSGRYTERPTEVSDVDKQQVNALLRRYLKAEVDPDPFKKLVPPALMEDMTVEITDPTGIRPQIISMTAGRNIREQELLFVESTPFLPSIGLILPRTGKRLGESWPLSRAGIAALVREPSSGEPLIAKLSKIIQDPSDISNTPRELALIDIDGKVQTQNGPMRVRASCTFAFRTPERNGDLEAAGETTDSVQAVGGLTKVLLTTLTTSSGRPNQSGGERMRQLTMERRLTTAEQTLVLPDAIEATPENSWILYADPKARYHFLHPQDFRLELGSLGESADRVSLIREFGKTPDLIGISFLKGNLPKPESVFKPMLERYREQGFDIIPGAMKRLPSQDWGKEKEVYRVEAVLTPAVLGATGGQVAQRIHFDGYVVLYDANTALTATLFTAREDVAVMRETLEKIIKEFKIGLPRVTAR